MVIDKQQSYFLKVHLKKNNVAAIKYELVLFKMKLISLVFAHKIGLAYYK